MGLLGYNQVASIRVWVRPVDFIFSTPHLSLGCLWVLGRESDLGSDFVSLTLVTLLKSILTFQKGFEMSMIIVSKN